MFLVPKVVNKVGSLIVVLSKYLHAHEHTHKYTHVHIETMGEDGVLFASVYVWVCLFMGAFMRVCGYAMHRVCVPYCDKYTLCDGYIIHLKVFELFELQAWVFAAVRSQI